MTETTRNRLAVGAKEIAKAVGLKPRQVYNLHEKHNAPIKNQLGIGLVADPYELRAWILGKHTENSVP